MVWIHSHGVYGHAILNVTRAVNNIYKRNYIFRFPRDHRCMHTPFTPRSYYCVIVQYKHRASFYVRTLYGLEDLDRKNKHHLVAAVIGIYQPQQRLSATNRVVSFGFFRFVVSHTTPKKN